MQECVDVKDMIAFTTKTKVKLIELFACHESVAQQLGGDDLWSGNLLPQPDEDFQMLISASEIQSLTCNKRCQAADISSIALTCGSARVLPHN